MHVITAKVSGPFIVKQDTEIIGIVDGNVAVLTEVRLCLYGKIVGSLAVEEGARVAVHGLVEGPVINYGGDVEVFGTVGGIDDRNTNNPIKLTASARLSAAQAVSDTPHDTVSDSETAAAGTDRPLGS